MNVLDNVISFFAPEWGARRAAWRRYGDEIRSYDAAGYGNGSANWRVINQSAEITDRYDRETVRARARDLERNSDMLNSVISAFKRNVFGIGYALTPQTKDADMDKILAESCLKGQTLIQNKPSILEGYFSASLEKALFCGLSWNPSLSMFCIDF